jgi:GT2 family glycosyltransferase
LDKNYGFAEENNRGVKFAQGDYLVFVYMDTRAKVDGLQVL